MTEKLSENHKIEMEKNQTTTREDFNAELMKEQNNLLANSKEDASDAETTTCKVLKTSSPSKDPAIDLAVETNKSIAAEINENVAKKTVQETASDNESPHLVDVDGTKDLSADAPSEKNEECTTRDIFNPTVSEEDEELLKVIRQNAIDDTMYNECYVLSILLKTTKVEKCLEEYPELENELCSLWDMTTEPQVVKFLLRKHVIDLFTKVIETIDDNRMQEIIVGILGNLLNEPEAKIELAEKPRTMQLFIMMLGSSDSQTLVQLMRVFSMAFNDIDAATTLKWYQRVCNTSNFVQSFMFILSNSLNKQLLNDTLQALNAILAKFAVLEVNEDEQNDLSTFEELFLKEELPESLLEAFDTLLPTDTDESREALLMDEENDISEQVIKTVHTFLNIHGILLQYGEFSRLCYARIENDLIKCLRYILQPLLDPAILISLAHFGRNVVEGMCTIFEAFGDPFDEIIVSHIFTIWQNAVKLFESLKKEKLKTAANDFEADYDNDDIEKRLQLYEIICNYALEFLVRTILNANGESLHQVLSIHSPKNVAQLVLTLGSGESITDERKECCRRIKDIFKDNFNENGSLN